MPDRPDVSGIEHHVLRMMRHCGRGQRDMRMELRGPAQSRQDADNVLHRTLTHLQEWGYCTHVHRFWTITELGLEALRNARARTEADHG